MIPIEHTRTQSLTIDMSEDTQHTPGPWENNGQYISKSFPDSDLPMIQIADAGKAHLIANPLTEEEAEANADLIARAPDMDDVLRRLAIMIEWWIDHPDDCTNRALCEAHLWIQRALDT